MSKDAASSQSVRHLPSDIAALQALLLEEQSQHEAVVSTLSQTIAQTGSAGTSHRAVAA